MAEPDQTQPNPEFSIADIKVLETSIKVHQPSHKIEAEWKPNATVDVKNRHEALAKDQHYEVGLQVQVKVELNDQLIFEAFVHQIGLFSLKNFANDQLENLLESYCLYQLLPYARSEISQLVAKTGFPPLYISPIDFESRYQARLKQTQES